MQNIKNMQNMQSMPNMQNIQNMLKQIGKDNPSKDKSSPERQDTSSKDKSSKKKGKSSQNTTVCTPSCREPNGSHTIVAKTKQFMYHCAEPPCYSVSAHPPLHRPLPIKYTALGLLTWRSPHGSGASSRLTQKTALVFSEQYSVCDGLHQLATSSIGLAARGTL